MSKGQQLMYFAVLAAFLPWTAAARFVCPSDGIFANPESCKTYYMCSGLKPILMTCGDQELFDTKINTCNWEDQVICSSGSTATPGTTSAQPTSTNAPTVAPTNAPTVAPTNAPTTTNNPSTTSSPKPVCPPTGQAVFANSNDCTSFYMCSEGASFLTKCPSGYGFNSIYMSCTISDNDCSASGAQSTTAAPDTPICPPTDSKRVVNPDDCNTFYICLGGQASLITCPVNHQFHEKLDKCFEAASSECGDFVTPNPIEKLCSEKPDGFLLPDPLDCSKFFQCSHGKAMSLNCPEGLEFSEDKNSCVIPSMSGCTATSPTY